MKYRTNGCIFIPWSMAHRIHPNIKMATDEDIKKLIEMSPNHTKPKESAIIHQGKTKNGDNMSIFEAIGKTLSKPAAKVGIAAAGVGAAAGSVLGASAASPTINNKSDSTTVGNGNEAIIGFAVILVVIAIIGYALYSKNNANQKEE